MHIILEGNMNITVKQIETKNIGRSITETFFEIVSINHAIPNDILRKIIKLLCYGQDVAVVKEEKDIKRQWCKLIEGEDVPIPGATELNYIIQAEDQDSPITLQQNIKFTYLIRSTLDSSD